MKTHTGVKNLSVGAYCENCEIDTISQGEYIPIWAKESEYKDMSLEEIQKLLHKDIEEKNSFDSNHG